MGIPAGVLKVVLSGRMPGAEVWACGLWFAIPSQSESAQVAAEHIADGTTSAFGSLTAWLASNNPVQWNLNRVQVYKYTGGGAASDVGSASLSLPGTGTLEHPNQTCLVSTLRSAQAGGSGRGRTFWPALSVPIQSDALVTTAVAQSLADAVAELMTGSASTGRVVSTTRTAAYPVTRVDVDRVCDSQQGRRRKLPDARVVGSA